ncbi:alpha/beta hydrolase [Streptomyces spectabilis]|uniref:Pimeloyl-ACP methyl ester carboxylesterase n=1 Tax=Streptomyces spectabilis TaxID=68270 RepID=A0A7W8EXS5_STRST|nr:alpha/beta hydrolase [Streptomyces spectabilis]MBB5108116.1 pimeloyl-ACP methyl ester carboxylesterase [Streptomyces spectabilis]
MRTPALTGVTALALALTALPAATGAEPPRPDLKRFYAQKVKWAVCTPEKQNLPETVTKNEDVRCGTLTVPLDYARPRSGTVDLALLKVKASGKKRGSLLVNFGGPGGPGVAGLAADLKGFGDLGKGYDVVGFDPRGVGLSEPVSCGDEPEPEGLDDPDDAGAVLEQLRRTAERCVKESGPVLPHIGTVNVSRDMDVMRAALGDKKLNYLGFSYGTRLGAVYAAQFPKKVGRMVLDGVDTLTEPVDEQGLASAEGQQTALDNFLLWCTKNAGCVFGDDSRRARETMVKVIEDLDAMPLRSTDGAEFTGQDVVSVLGSALYSRQAWPALSQALGALLADGDPRALMRVGGAGGMGVGHGFGRGFGHGFGHGRQDVPQDNETAALAAVNCADDPDRPGARKVEKEIGRLQQEFEEVSPVFGEHNLTLVLMCFGWPAGTSYIRKEVRDVDTPKLLLVGTRGDPATPYRWTEETARRLGSSAVVLDNKGDGHTGYFGSKCVKAKVDGFLLYKQLPANGSSCAAEWRE